MTRFFRVEVREFESSAAMTGLTHEEATALIDRLRAAFIEPICIMVEYWKRGEDDCPYAF